MAEFSFAIPRVPKSINRMSKHWSGGMKEKKDWLGRFLLIKAASPEFDFEPKVKRRIKITVYWPAKNKRCRLPDDDNLIAGFKWGRDAMKRLGFIKDDSPKWSEWHWSIKRADEGLPCSPGKWDERQGWTNFTVEDSEK